MGKWQQTQIYTSQLNHSWLPWTVSLQARTACHSEAMWRKALPASWLAEHSWTLEPRHLGKLVRWSQFQEVNLWSGLFTSPRQGHCVSHSMWPRAFREGCCSLSLLPVVAKGSTQAGRRVSRMPRANRFLFQKLCHPEVLTPAIGRHYWLTLGFFT